VNGRIAVVTDSTACLPPQVAERLGVRVLQMRLQIGGWLHEENRVSTDLLVDLLRKHTPVSTAPPETDTFARAYRDAAALGAGAVVSLHISARQSATCQAAADAAAGVDIPVHVIDTATTGMSLGFAVLTAAEAARTGASVQQVITAVGRRLTDSTEIIYVDTLEYLRRGGRIGAAAAVMGTALSVKPLLTMAEGQVAPMARAFGTERALRRIVETAIELADDRPVDLAVEHFAAEEQANRLLERLRERLPASQNCMLTQVSAVIGTHVGPGALGVTVAPR
jgi:DegV family protein with EDD domain